MFCLGLSLAAPCAAASELLEGAIDRLFEEMMLRTLPRDDLSMPDRASFGIALKAQCSLLESRPEKEGLRRDRLLWVDYSQPSSRKRLYLFDLKRGELLHQTYATHGFGSIPEVEVAFQKRTGRDVRYVPLIRRRGYQESRFFSNRPGSKQSTLGTAIADTGTYFSKTFESLALRLIGVDPSLNANLLERAIVFHAWGYTDAAAAQGFLPASQGCLMFPYRDTFEGIPETDVNRLMIRELKGVPVFLYHPRLLDRELNKRVYSADLEEYGAMRTELARRVETEGVSARLLEFEKVLERQWLKRAKETRAYFSRGSRFIGHEPADEVGCVEILRGF
jgi:hypothetical protein